ncbi:MAG TPA: tetratricopeptide repeat protein [Gemmatimonadales bacterium]|nr:tetratricopeptide repeat protein [Gemmatimonadales bacterium]
MSDGFLGSDEFDEHAHQLYNEGRYEEALEVLKDGLALYPNTVELHVGMAYAHLAREEYPWARRSFESALTLDGEHEDALAGYGEVLLKLGQVAGAIAAFDRIVRLGLADDHELMLQIGRAFFREGQLAQAHRFFELGVLARSDAPEPAACLGYTCHRLGREADAFYWIRRALELDPAYSEARIYLANTLYDRGETEAALYHLEKTGPEDHFDDLALWRMIELRKLYYRLPDDDPELSPWMRRLGELAPEPDSLDELLAEIEATQPDGSQRDPNQLELFGAMLTELHAMQRRGGPSEAHAVATLSGSMIRGTWEEILLQFKASQLAWVESTLGEFMSGVAQQGRAETGVVIPVADAEAFIRGSAQAGVLRILQ